MKEQQYWIIIFAFEIWNPKFYAQIVNSDQIRKKIDRADIKSHIPDAQISLESLYWIR